MSTAIEKSWPAVPPQLLTADGTNLGVINVANSSGFKVKQQVVISATGQPDLIAKIMRFNSPTQFRVGPVSPKAGQGLTGAINLSAYTVAAGAFVYAQEQPKVTIKPEDIIQAVYRQEPGTTIGVELDDEFGNAFNINNPLPVSASPLWDEIDLAYDANQNLETVEYKKGAQEITLTLIYDANQNLTKVTKS